MRKDSRKPWNETGARGPRKGTRYLPTTDKSRQAMFLRALRESGGSFAAACAASAPHLDGNSVNPPGYSSWRNLMARDPGFAAAVAETLQIVADDIEAEMHRRSIVGVAQPVYQKAQRVMEPVLDEDGQPALDKNGKPQMRAASIVRYSDALLMRRAAAIMPEKYSEKRTVDINHNVNKAVAWQIGTDDLAALTAEQRQHLRDIMESIRDHRREMAAIEHQPADVIDADFEEVDEPAQGEDCEPEVWELAYDRIGDV